MTAPAVPAKAGAASQLTPTNFAHLGAQLSAAGFDEEQITAFLAQLQFDAQAMAHDLAVKATGQLLGLINNVHKATAMAIYRELTIKQNTILGAVHAGCAQVALNIANQPPRRR